MRLSLKLLNPIRLTSNYPNNEAVGDSPKKNEAVGAHKLWMAEMKVIGMEQNNNANEKR